MTELLQTWPERLKMVLNSIKMHPVKLNPKGDSVSHLSQSAATTKKSMKKTKLKNTEIRVNEI